MEAITLKIGKKIALGILFLALACGVFFGMMVGFGVIDLKKDTTSSHSGVQIADNNGSRDSIRSELDEDTETEEKAPVTATIKQTDACTVEEITDFDMTELVENALPSICSVVVKGEANSMWYGTYQYTASGSGIVISEDDDNYYIATNAHVISGYTSVSILLANTDANDDNSQSYEVTVKGSDTSYDLAVLVLQKSSLTETDKNYIKVATLADSSTAEAGNPVVAIGNALGYGLSVTAGYVSAVDREVSDSDGSTMKLIQTDAAINPGNSGGALINTNGEIIGINSSKLSSTSIEGMGFAIPINTALPLLTELTELEEVPEEEQGYLGVYIKEITSDLSEQFDLPIGVFITQVMENSSADAAGLMASDVIVGVNGIEIKTSEQLVTRVTSYRAGTTITLSVMRKNSDSGEYEQIEVPVTLMTKDKMTTTE